MDNDDIPPLRRPEDMPPVLTQADLHRHWRALMGPLGFGSPRLYVQFVPPDGRVEGMILEVDELPDLPDERMADGLFDACRSVIETDLPEATRVAVLYAHPGRGGDLTERTWGRALTAAAERAGVPVWEVHVANDVRLRVLAPDDLVEPA
jgi:hypothetical protein